MFLKPIGLALALALIPTSAAAEVVEAPIAKAIARAFQRPTDAEAQRREAERAAAEKAERDRLNLATFVFLGAAGADWAVTSVCAEVRCNDHAGYSASYFIGGDGFENKGTAIVLGLALDTAIVLFAREVVADDHPKLARAILFIAAGVRVVIMTNKIGDLRRNAVRVPQP